MCFKKKNSWSKIGRKQKKKKNFQSKIEKKQKKNINSRSRIRRKQKNIQKGHWTKQCLNNVQNCHEQERQEKKPWLETHEAVPFLVTNWIFVPASLSCRAKKETKKEKAETLRAKFPTKTPFSKKSYWSMITHVIFDLIGNDLQNQVMSYLWFWIRMKHLPVWDWYILSDFLLFLLDPVFPLNGRLETKC